MRFLADMGVSARVVAWLRDEGHDVWHLRERELHRAADETIFAAATAENRIVLTFDLDFGEIVARSRGATSVLLFRLNDTTVSSVIRRLQDVLARACEALDTGAIVVVEDWRFRVRRLPLGT